MTRISSDGPELRDFGMVEVRTAELGGYTVDFLTFKQPVDMTLMLRGLPDDRCQCPHWGVVAEGSMVVRYADHEETAGTGDAFYMPPGHVPTYEVGTRLIQFSPTEDLKATDEAIQRNLQALQDA
jgi:AraC-like ligand binding domain